jgi:hypothetical protein
MGNIEITNKLICFVERIPGAASCNPLDVISIVLSLFALVLAWLIPRRIMVNQLYSELLHEYRGTEMGAAIWAIFHFFTHDCKNDVSNIRSEYIAKYNKQIGNQDSEKIDPAKTLHFQRRLLSQFYSDMAALHYEHGLLGLSKRKLKSWFTPNEVKLLSILLYMAEPAREVFIQANDVPEPPDDDIPMNRLIKRLYDEVEGLD